MARLAMVKAAGGTRTKWLVGDYFRIFYDSSSTSFPWPILKRLGLLSTIAFK